MSHPSLKDRVVIVTGGARGLGKVMTLALAQAGARVLVVARSADEIAATVAEANAFNAGAVQGHVSDVSRWEDCVASVDMCEQTFGSVQVLVNNAGFGLSLKPGDPPPGAPRPFWTLAPEDIAQGVSVNLLGPFALFHAAAPRMIAGGFGKVISISTSLPTMRRPNGGAYGPVKAALEAATRIWAQELEGTGVTANILLPGGISDTAFVPGPNVGQRAKPFAAGKGPLGLEGTNADFLPASIMGPPILWLVSDESNGFSGRRFVARDWDPDLPQTVAAERAMQAPADKPVIM